jgi:hypothetical protein
MAYYSSILELPTFNTVGATTAATAIIANSSVHTCITKKGVEELTSKISMPVAVEKDTDATSDETARYSKLCYTVFDRIPVITRLVMHLSNIDSGYTAVYKKFVAAYVEINKTAEEIDTSCRDESFYNFWLTLNFKKRSLYIGLNTPKRKCIFSFTSGMFLPNYRASSSSREYKKKQLDFLRSLKHKEKKLVKKKTKVLR